LRGGQPRSSVDGTSHAATDAAPVAFAAIVAPGTYVRCITRQRPVAHRSNAVVIVVVLSCSGGATAALVIA